MEDSLPNCQVCGKAAEGVINIGMYSTTLDNPENQRFVTAILAKLQSEPVIFHTTPWIAGQLIVKAVDDLKGELDDPDRVVKALKAAGEGLRTPVGEVRFDAYNQIVQAGAASRALTQERRCRAWVTRCRGIAP